MVYEIFNKLFGLDSLGIFSVLGGSFKLMLLTLVAMIVLGLIASGIEQLINRILGLFMGSEFAFIFCNFLTFPGTILHELSHAFVATITGAKVTEISFFDFGPALGHVSYRTRGNKFMRALQNSLTACAPVISGCIALPLLIILLGKIESIPAIIGVIYLIVSVIDHMTMSIIDIVNYFKGIWASAIFFFVLHMILLIAINI